jgi:ketosteroid isomerase-like protein
MTKPTEIVASFYNKLKAGHVAGALGLMALDIEWIAIWHYEVDGRGPERTAEGLFKRLMAEWSSFALAPYEFILQGGGVVTLGAFTGVHGATGKSAHAGYAHVLDNPGRQNHALPPVRRQAGDRRGSAVLNRPTNRLLSS